jgi:hypothetical protein
VKYELGFYIPEGDNLHSHRRENLESSLQAISLSPNISVSTYCPFQTSMNQRKLSEVSSAILLSVKTDKELDAIWKPAPLAAVTTTSNPPAMSSIQVIAISKCG